MRDHVRSLSRFYDITLITSGDSEDVKELMFPNVNYISLDIPRRISIGRDVLCLFFLVRHLRLAAYDCIFTLMPKSGLIGMLAGFMARTAVRVHIFTGQVWVTKSGLFRYFLKLLDKLLALSSTHLLSDSHSQKQFLIDGGITKESKIQVLGHGSISGVDTSRFTRIADARHLLREKLGIDESALVFLFLGRVSREKGVLDLARAFERLANEDATVHLLIIGPDDDDVDNELRTILSGSDGRYHRQGFTDTPELWMSASDIFCLPSYREGFGLAVVEAASVGLPAIVSRIYGLTDAVKDGVTGVFHLPGDVSGLYSCMKLLNGDPSFRLLLAQQARTRVADFFSQAYVTNEMTSYFQNILK
ncbi:glycosyltransferase [Pseudomonas brassicacearum]|nr:glycosyltransferase [Pseudomonas brassicacearum]